MFIFRPLFSLSSFRMYRRFSNSSLFIVNSTVLSAYLKAGLHLFEFGRAAAQPALSACVVCFSEEDSLVTVDRATEFGSRIDFYFFATSRSSTNQFA